jgi:hypothetical protein
MSAAISWASLRLSGKFGIVACGKSKNEAIISELIVFLAAMDAKDDALLDLPGPGPMAWHSEHHRSDNRLPFSMFCARVVSMHPKSVSPTERYNGTTRIVSVPWGLLERLVVRG